MRRSSSENSNQNQNESDFSRDFVPGVLNDPSGQPRCSTTRKQQRRLEIEMEEDEAGAEDPQCADEDPADPECGVEDPADPECAVVDPADSHCAPQEAPETTAAPRRRQATPLSRAEKMRREIRRLQHTPYFMIPRLPFARVVREIIMNECINPFRITETALEALQTATEMFMTQRFQDAYFLTAHRSRVTLEVRDMALMAYICKQHGHL